MKNTLNILKQERKRTSEYLIPSKMCFSSNFWERIGIFWKIILFIHIFDLNGYRSGSAGPGLDSLPVLDPVKWCRSDRIRIRSPRIRNTGFLSTYFFNFFKFLSKNSWFGTGSRSVPDSAKPGSGSWFSPMAGSEIRFGFEDLDSRKTPHKFWTEKQSDNFPGGSWRKIWL
jgi:hypothetical protein